MNRFNEILDDIYNYDFNMIGYSVDYKLAFIVRYKSQVYLVLLMAAYSFIDNKHLWYKYAIYSLTDSRCVLQDTKEYKKLLAILPKTDKLNLNQITVDWNELHNFYTFRDSVINEICVAKTVAESLKSEYAKYLNRLCEIYEDNNLLRACDWFKNNF